jgi:putative redox protein
MSPEAPECIGKSEEFMQATAIYSGDVKFEVAARGHRVICDQPVPNGGTDAGMSPPEFLLASLATCAGYYAAQYLKARSLPADGLRVVVDAEKAADRPGRLGSFRIEVVAPGLDEKHQEGVLRAVKACLVHNTLLHPPAIETVVTTESPASAEVINS